MRARSGLTMAAVFLVLGPGEPPAAAAAAAAGKRERPRPAVSRAPLPVEVVQRWRADLLTGDDTAAVAAAKALGDSGAPNAAAPLVEALAVGARPVAVGAAIEALGKLAEPSAVEVLAMYARHRAPSVRKRAVEALAAIREARVAKPVVATLLDRLGDAAPEVRRAAADALAARRERQAAPRLLALFRKNEDGVAAPLGLVAPADMVSRIADLHGSVDDGKLVVALGELVKRPDLADPLRLEVVKTLGGIPGPAATTALVDYLGVVPPGENRRSKKEAEARLKERGE